ncbi:MAG: EamA family transporter [Candidatus Wallbacteria bacterium]
MTYVYLAFTILFWGTGQTFLKLGLAKSTPISSFLVGGLAGLVVGLPYILTHELQFAKWEILFPMVFVIAMCYLTFYYSLNAGELSVTSAVLGTYPLYTVIFAVLFLGETLIAKQWTGLLIIITGVGLLSAASNPGEDKKKMTANDKIWFAISILSALLIGVGDALSKVVVTHATVATYLLYFNIVQIIMGTLLKLIFEKGNFNFSAIKSRHSFIGMFLLNLGGIVFMLALESGNASVIVPLSSTYIALVTLLSWLFLGEKFNTPKTIGIFMVIGGISMI